MQQVNRQTDENRQKQDHWEKPSNWECGVVPRTRGVDIELSGPGKEQRGIDIRSYLSNNLSSGHVVNKSNLRPEDSSGCDFFSKLSMSA